ncbi:MAG: hypothetical protein SFT91_05610 [Rickettsiaceae bacterium]|nr:hypothetical protein [Rickettsiaceae bacterium]
MQNRDLIRTRIQNSFLIDSEVRDKYLSIGRAIIKDLLEDIDFSQVKKILILGGRGSIFSSTELGENLHIEEQYYTNQELSKKYDIIISFYDISTIVDINMFLIWVKFHLNENGVFAGCFVGEESLMNTRLKLWALEEKIEGGYSNRILPMIRLQNFNQLLYQSGFVNLISFSERISLGEGNIYKFLRYIRECGDNSSEIAPVSTIRPISRKLYQAIAKSKENYNDNLDIIGFCSSSSTALFANKVNR